jgi:hypothetical protein
LEAKIFEIISRHRLVRWICRLDKEHGHDYIRENLFAVAAIKNNPE